MLNGIDLSISKGDYLLLCGGSGSGKTTLAYLLNGLVPHFFEGTLEGSVTVHGRATKDCTVGDMITSVGLVFQNAEAQLFNSTVEDEIAFGLESLGRPSDEIENAIEETAGNAPHSTPPGQVSGHAVGRRKTAGGHCFRLVSAPPGPGPG